jgi:phosphopentomutase
LTRRAAVIVLDGVGIGAAPDADAYGDSGSRITPLVRSS